MAAEPTRSMSTNTEVAHGRRSKLCPTSNPLPVLDTQPCRSATIKAISAFMCLVAKTITINLTISGN